MDDGGCVNFTIITPTVQRETLRQTCDSLNGQTFTDWQHIIMNDCEFIDDALWKQLENPQRMMIQCQKPHGNGGNTCRHNAYEHATGDYLIYLDDDNTLADDNVLKDIHDALWDTAKDSLVLPPWALFPITRLGQRFYCDPPRSCHVDTLNVVLRRDIAQWPDTDAYGSDGILVDSLMAQGIPYVAFPDFRPIAIIPVINGAKR